MSIDGQIQTQPVEVNPLVAPTVDGIIVHRKIKILEVNATLAAMFGYEPGDLTDAERTILDLIYPEARSMVLKHTLIKYERPYEAVGLRKDGSTFPIKIIDQPLANQESAIRAMVIQPSNGEKNSEDMLAVLQASRQALTDKLLKTTSQLRYANERLQLELDERAQMEAELRVRVRQQRAVAELSQRALASTDLALLMKDAVTIATQVLEAELASIFELNPTRDGLRLTVGVGWSAGLVDQTELELTADYPAGFAILTKQPVIIENLPVDSRFSEAGLLHRHQVVSGLCLVILGRSEPLGILELHTTRRRRFSEDDLHFLQAIANILSMTIERTRNETQLKAAAMEQAALLREIHDRVKNNLQVILSLLSLQADYRTDQHSQQILQAVQNRVQAMALIHEMLYGFQSLAQVEFGRYVEALLGHLFWSYGAYARGVSFRVQGDELFLTMGTAVPCGLIINELVTNALQHAFPDGHGGQVQIEFCKNSDGRFKLTVADNGLGLPAGLDFREADTLGLQLVKTLVDQLEGIIELQPAAGTAFKITFYPEQGNYSNLASKVGAQPQPGDLVAAKVKPGGAT